MENTRTKLDLLVEGTCVLATDFNALDFSSVMRSDVVASLSFKINSNSFSFIICLRVYYNGLYISFSWSSLQRNLSKYCSHINDIST